MKAKKKLTLLVTVALLLLVAVGSTLAYLYISTGALSNTFAPGRVSCAVVENGNAYTDSTVSGMVEKSNVTVRNTGSASAYIRAAVVVTWKSSDGHVYAAKPQLGTDYTMSMGSGWTPADGFYYCNSSVAADADSPALIVSASQLSPSILGTDGQTVYHLSVEIVAEAIQAEGLGENVTALTAWDVAAQQD